MKGNLSAEIKKNSKQLIELIEHYPQRTEKIFIQNHSAISIADILAYQIGWGKALIRWYESGINNENPLMPGDGFSKWDYTAIAVHFHHKYAYDSAEQQLKAFTEVVSRILEIIAIETQTGNLEKLNIWSWCTLSSGKPWPLSKWVKVNTASPYKRAIQLIKASRPK
jgi:hypothetical protein